MYFRGTPDTSSNFEHPLPWPLLACLCLSENGEHIEPYQGLCLARELAAISIPANLNLVEANIDYAAATRAIII